MGQATFREWMNKTKTSSLAGALQEWGPQRIGRFQVAAGMTTAESLQDSFLASQGIVLNKVSGTHDVDVETKAWVLAARVGIALRAVNQIKAHLTKRQSEGKPTLQQKTVQSELGEALSLLTEVLALVDLDGPLTALPLEDLDHMDRCVTEAGSRLSRLMGGHGYTEGGIEYPFYLSHQLWTLTQEEVAA